MYTASKYKFPHLRLHRSQQRAEYHEMHNRVQQQRRELKQLNKSLEGWQKAYCDLYKKYDNLRKLNEQK